MDIFWVFSELRVHWEKYFKDGLYIKKKLPHNFAFSSIHDEEYHAKLTPGQISLNDRWSVQLLHPNWMKFFENIVYNSISTLERLLILKGIETEKQVYQLHRIEDSFSLLWIHMEYVFSWDGVP